MQKDINIFNLQNNNVIFFAYDSPSLHYRNLSRKHCRESRYA